MDSIREIKGIFKNKLTLPLEPHSTFAVREVAISLVGSSLYTAIICKALNCSSQYAPQYLLLIGTILVGLFIYILYDTYHKLEDAFDEWMSERDHIARVKKLEILVRKGKGFPGKGVGNTENLNRRAEYMREVTESGIIRKSKRKNHRGGVKAKKGKGKGIGNRTAIVEDMFWNHDVESFDWRR